MKLLFKERIFSWLDSYDVYNEYEEPVFIVQGAVSFGHRLIISDASGLEVGEIKEKVFSLLHTFDLFEGERYLGQMKKEFTFFTPVYHIYELGWEIKGNIFEYDYEIKSGGDVIAVVSKEFFHFSDTYAIDIADNINPLHVLMTVLAIDAEKCSDN